MLDQLDSIPWNKFHRKVSMALGLGWGMDAFEVTLIGSILGVLGPLWHLSGFILSAILGAWFAGIMLGALGFGLLADRFGRRAVFLASLVIYGGATFATAFAPGIAILLLLRFVAGVGVGAEYSAVNAAIAELIPSAKRGFAASFVMNFWSVGTLFAAFLSWLLFSLLPPDFAWRVVFACGGLVALSTLWLRRTLPESPRWLLAQGREVEAQAIVAAIQRGTTCLPNVGMRSGKFVRVKSHLVADLRALVTRHKAALALGCVLDFAEAGGYYGLFAFLPLAVLPNLHLATTALPLFYMAGSLGALLGGIIVSLLLDRLGRKPVVSFCYGATALACLGFAAAAPTGATPVIIGFVVVNMLATASWVGAYPTFSELFPTNLRASGIGISVAVGRIGALMSPFLIAYAGQTGVAAALAVLAGFWAIGFLAMVVWLFAGVEARGVSLERLSKFPA
ncbi:MAG TPA: MFS transporter [Acidocella sp.]|nr:MAG: MFS transporter [Acidocella sp. 20-58-15]HQT38622.1 MFS transporter [Acidocella sp.]